MADQKETVERRKNKLYKRELKVLIKFVQNAIGNFRIFMMVSAIYAGIKYITILIRSIKNLKLIDGCFIFLLFVVGRQL